MTRGRPASSPISREAIVEAALALVDANGMANLSMRKLGAELGIDGSSLYHYFSGKDEIIDAITARVLSHIRPHTGPIDDWKTYLVETCLKVRRAVAVHPNITPALTARRQWRFGLAVFEDTAQVMSANGIDPAYQLVIWESLDALTVGSALLTTSAAWATSEIAAFESTFPAVYEAVHADRVDEETALELSARAFLTGIEVVLGSGRPQQ
ncbi:MAG: TetR family transcriptional regulator [Acidimicrobiia bacterium]|nr:TetR family transcriptional regulator [Acidimicrobiia bacterium]